MRQALHRVLGHGTALLACVMFIRSVPTAKGKCSVAEAGGRGGGLELCGRQPGGLPWEGTMELGVEAEESVNGIRRWG